MVAVNRDIMPTPKNITHETHDPAADGNRETVPVTDRADGHHGPPDAVPDGMDVGIGRPLFEVVHTDGAEDDDAERDDRNQNGALPDQSC